MPKRDLKIRLERITKDNIEQLRKINTVSFPLQYPESFYTEVLQRQNVGLDKLVYYKDTVVGALCSRVEPLLDDDDEDESSPPSVRQPHRLYIMTLAVLAAYRGRGIGSALLRSVLEYCGGSAQQPPPPPSTKEGAGAVVVISEIALHVQTSNRDAIRFYTDKFGFVQGELVENYYSRRIDPPHCYLLYKKIKHDGHNHRGDNDEHHLQPMEGGASE